MGSLSLHVRYRPVRIGWCVESARFEHLQSALRLTHAFAGGRCNPVIPVDRTELAEYLVDRFRLTTLEPGSTAPDFCEVVKRGANITYCTTSAGDLEALADATQSFDWTIIEEAGKAHGFDLALPLQAGRVQQWLALAFYESRVPDRTIIPDTRLVRLRKPCTAPGSLAEHYGGVVAVAVGSMEVFEI